MNLPSQDTCFRHWLASRSNDDLRQALGADVGEMIRDQIRAEIERRGISASIIPFRQRMGSRGSDTIHCGAYI